MFHFSFTNGVKNKYLWYNDSVLEMSKRCKVSISKMAKIWFSDNVCVF